MTDLKRNCARDGMTVAGNHIPLCRIQPLRQIRLQGDGQPRRLLGIDCRFAFGYVVSIGANDFEFMEACLNRFIKIDDDHLWGRI